MQCETDTYKQNDKQKCPTLKPTQEIQWKSPKSYQLTSLRDVISDMQWSLLQELWKWNVVISYDIHVSYEKICLVMNVIASGLNLLLCSKEDLSILIYFIILLQLIIVLQSDYGFE